MSKQPPLLEVQDIKVYFPIRRGLLNRQVGHVKAVDGVSFHVHERETFGLVGESGCGKSTLGRTIVQLQPATEGQVLFKRQNVSELSKTDKQAFKRHVQMIFQDPFSSLNPRQKVGDILAEPYSIHTKLSHKEKQEKVYGLLEKVGLNPAHINRYPHQFSGGQRQRIGIARALALNPSLIVCDEPVSALDVSIQAQIVNLLEDLQEELGISYIFIAHDLSIVKYISHRIGVMYLGNLVELATTEELFANPQHPYTKTLLSSIPAHHPRMKRERIVLQGEIPNPANPPQGCKFHPRCPYAEAKCKTDIPTPKTHNGHLVACHLIN